MGGSQKEDPMGPQVLACNVRRYRLSRRMSQSSLAKASSVSLPAIRNLEGAKGEPRVRTLQNVAEALGVKLTDLLREERPLQTVRFRSQKKLRSRENILAQVSRWLTDYAQLELLLNQKVPSVLVPTPGKDPVSAAAIGRKQLGVAPEDPICDICGLLERMGVRIRLLPIASEGFFGLSVGERDGGPAVVVNSWQRISVERQIFSAAHELGHLVLHESAYDVVCLEENPVEEKEANLFAGHFLMPEAGFCQEWQEAAGLNWVDRVLKVKRVFRVSYKAVLSRLIEDGKADQSVWKEFNIAFQRRWNKKLSGIEEPLGLDSHEPAGLHRFDFYEDRFSRLVRLAVEGDLISFGRGAEMLGIGVSEMQKLFAGWQAV